MYEFLTLAITETNPLTGEFAVVAMELKSKTITKFSLKKEEIISNQCEVFWDIGFVTSVKDIIRPSFSNNYRQSVAGVDTITNKIKDLKNILEAKSTNPKEFFENENTEYAVVKISNVIDITMNSDNENYQDEVLKFYLKVNISGIPIYEATKNFLNKDFRWKKYWSYVFHSSEFDKKKNQYIKLLNNKKKALYLILYRHKFPDGKTWYWIAGMHWL